MSVKNWPADERPRERVLKGEIRKLTDAELLSLIFRHGIPGKDVVSLCRGLIDRFGGLRGLFATGREGLQSESGLGPAKTAALLAVKEISRRVLRETMVRKNYLSSPEAVVDYLCFEMRDYRKEVYKIIFLDKANCVLLDEDISEGTVDQAPVYIREVIARSLECGATAILMVHNHPSGRLEPSPEDREITRKTVHACGFVSVDVLDHIIVGGNGYFSFREHGFL